MGLSWTGSLEGSHDGIPYGSFLGDSLMNPSDGSFDSSSDVPPKRVLLGGTIEEAGCGTWLMTFWCLAWRLNSESFIYIPWWFQWWPTIRWIAWSLTWGNTAEGFLRVTMMAHHGVTFFEIHLRSPAVGPTHGVFLRPACSWLLRSYNLFFPAMSEAVGKNLWHVW